MGNLCPRPPPSDDAIIVSPPYISQVGGAGGGDGSEGNIVLVSSRDVRVTLRDRQLPPTPDQLRARPVYRALFDFTAINPDDLSFKKGDLLEVKTDTLEDSWWLAKNLNTLEDVFGYIPRNYVRKDDGTPQAQEWWFDVSREDAIRLLMRPGYPRGTFLVRHATDRVSLVLSVRDVDADNNPSIKHYRVKNLDAGGVYISTKKKFPSIQDLIKSYKRSADGLCTPLTQSFQKAPPSRTFRDWEVSRDAVKLGDRIGYGCFGEVYKGRLWNAIDVAVKTLKAGTMSSDRFLEEAKIMHKLEHERLVQLVAVVTEDEPYLIMTEFMVNGSLLEFLRNDQGAKVTYTTLVDIAAQIADGMAYLEKNNFIHRDLRAANILVGEHLEVKVADFGLARLLEDDGIYDAQSSTKFPIKWTAPESALYAKAFTIKSDVWSYGVLLYEMITFGKVPYAGMGGMEVLNKVDSGYRLPKPVSPIEYRDQYYDVMLQCWHRKPQNRPTFEHLLNHFKDFNVASEDQYADGMC